MEVGSIGSSLFFLSKNNEFDIDNLQNLIWVIIIQMTQLKNY